MDWEAEGLLEDCPDEDAKKARRALLEELHADGVGLDELKEAVTEQRLSLLPLERVIGGEKRYTAREVAEEAGIELRDLTDNRRALGLAVPDPDEPVFGDEDVKAAKISKQVMDGGFEREALLETNRVLGRGIARYVEALRTTIAEAALEPGSDEHELARRFAELGSELVPLNAPWMQYVFALHLRQMLRNEAVTFQERAAGRGETRRAAVAFADLVGFTELGQTVDVDELSDVAARLSRMAGEVVDPPVQLVKVIGDAVMLVAPGPKELGQTVDVDELSDVAARLSRMAGEVVDPPVQLVKVIGDAVMLVAPGPKELVGASLALVERAEETDDFPQVRAGVAFGPAANHFGDWYGSTVNLASRLTARARPGSVLVTADVHDELGEDGYAWSQAGPKRLKGFSEPVRTFRVRRAAAA